MEPLWGDGKIPMTLVLGQENVNLGGTGWGITDIADPVGGVDPLLEGNDLAYTMYRRGLGRRRHSATPNAYLVQAASGFGGTADGWAKLPNVAGWHSLLGSRLRWRFTVASLSDVTPSGPYYHPTWAAALSTRGIGLTTDLWVTDWIDVTQSDSRFVAVGVLATGGGTWPKPLWLAWRQSNERGAPYSRQELDLEWSPGDMVTWDLLWPKSRNVVSMRFQVQRLRGDTPTSQVIDVPASAFPFVATSVPPTAAVQTVPCLFVYDMPDPPDVALEGTITLLASPWPLLPEWTETVTVSYIAHPPATPPGATGRRVFVSVAGYEADGSSVDSTGLMWFNGTSGTVGAVDGGGTTTRIEAYVSGPNSTWSGPNMVAGGHWHGATTMPADLVTAEIRAVGYGGDATPDHPAEPDGPIVTWCGLLLESRGDIGDYEWFGDETTGGLEGGSPGETPEDDWDGGTPVTATWAMEMDGGGV